MLGLFFVFLASFLWAFDTLFRYPLVGSGLNPLTIVFFEHVFLCLVFFCVNPSFFKRLWRAPLSDLFAFFMIGGVGSALATICFTHAFALLNPSLVILLQKFQPCFAVLLACLILQEKIHKKFLIWGLVCFVGGVMISWEEMALPEKVEGGLTGLFLVFISILGWSGATVFGKLLSNKEYQTQDILTGRFFMGLIVMLPFLSSLERSLTLDFNQGAKIVLMGLVSGVLAMYFYYKGLKKVSARTCALAEMAFPFFAVTVNWLFLDKQLTSLQLLGGGVLLLGASIIQWNKY